MLHLPLLPGLLSSILAIPVACLPPSSPSITFTPKSAHSVALMLSAPARCVPERRKESLPRATPAEAPNVRTLQDLARSLAQHGDAPALESSHQIWSYTELSAWTDRLAQALSDIGIIPGDTVALATGRGVSGCVGILSILQLGAAYVPIDPSLPAERQGWMAEDAGVLAVVGLLPGTELPQLDPMAYAHPQASGNGPASRPRTAPRHAEPSDPAWIIYTSGTTGQPKGVVVSHAAAHAFIEAEAHAFHVRPADRVWQGLSLSFDASVEELWLAWRAGACLVLATDHETKDPQATVAAVEAQRITVLSSVPSFLAMVQGTLPTVSLLITGGESCTPELAQRFSLPGRKFINTYGPTEATVVATWQEMRPDTPISIGHPFPHIDVMVMDAESGAPSEPGQEGELWLGGIALANGYQNLPDLTAEKFAPHASLGGRWYRTGDRVAEAPDGSLHYLGRLDGQVKLRGYRIELEEIETHLRRLTGHPAVAAAVKHQSGRPLLCAYIVGGFNEPELRANLAAALPSHCLPHHYQQVSELPLKLSGKVDRDALPAPVSIITSAPETILEAWQELFPHRPIAPEADFFTDLGGDSLSAALLVSRLRLMHPAWAQLSIRTLYETPDYAGLESRLALLAEPHSHPATPATPAAVSFPYSAARHFWCGCAQALSIVALVLLKSLPWFLLIANVHHFQQHGALHTFLTISWLAWLFLPYPSMAVVALGKRLIAPHIPTGDHPLWGLTYFRFWLSRHLHLTLVPKFLHGSPFMPVLLRWLGARIGTDCRIDTADLALTEHLHLADGVSVEADAHLHPWTVEKGVFRVRPIHIGAHARIGAKAHLGPGSHIPAHATVAANQSAQIASSIRPEDNGCDRYPSGSTVAWLAHYALFSLLGSLPMLAVATLVLRLYFSQQIGLGVAITLGVLLNAGLTLLVAALSIRWFQRRLPTTSFPSNSPAARHHWQVQAHWQWISSQLFPFLASVFTPSLLRACGARVGAHCEVSTIEALTPSHLTLAEGSFLADAVACGPISTHGGQLHLGTVRLGARAFVGNNSLIPGGTGLAPGNLAGVLTTVRPEMQTDPATATPPRSWIGSPALELPRRSTAPLYPESATFQPSISKRLGRGAWEFARFFIADALAWIFLALASRAALQSSGPFQFWQVCAWLLVGSIGIVTFTIAAKWLLLGRIRVSQLPLWHSHVWRSEFVSVFHEHAAVTALVGALRGTPFISWYFRAMGAQFGRGVYCDTIYLTEFDLVEAGDHACLNSNVDPQTHLFEDRVMKCGYVKIGAGTSIGSAAVVLYDTVIGPDTIVEPLSLIMKGERLPAATRWIGSPAEGHHTSLVPTGH